ncbi:MAG: carbohydrate kinase family protein [Terriglobales bacterium]
MTPERRLDVLVAGDLFLDLVMSGFTSWPGPGEESFAKEFHKEVGGGAAITACCLSKLGLRTLVLGAVGKSDGQWMVDELRLRGVDTSGIWVTGAEPTAFTVSVSSARDRALFTYGGANRELVGVLERLTALAEETRVRHIHLAHAMNPPQAAPLFQSIRDRGCSLSLDVGWHPEWFGDPQAIAALSLVDIFFPNEREASAITKETDPSRMLEAFQEMGLRQVALKLGAEGAALLWDGEITFQKAGPVEPVDTTGAGDCFDAGFLYAWLRGMEQRQCLRAGTACGELSVRALGGIAGVPSKEELDSILCTVK